MESRVLGETRTIDVSLPRGYETDTTQRYPVVVVLDAEFEHGIAVAIARFYAVASQLPPLIVVGVRNTNRMRDLTPAPRAGFTPPPEAAAGAGGADRFVAFIADELLPYLERSYRTSPIRVLTGHSLGGLFALYCLARRPDLFLGYVVMEPSAWWNNQHEFAEARAALQRPSASRARVMMVNTMPLDLDTTSWGGARPMVRHLATTGETHTSMAISGMMQGLRVMFADFKPAEWRPGTRPIAMLDQYDSLTARVGYSVPITEPTFALVARMSLDSRHFEDADRVLARMEAAYGASSDSKQLRERLSTERATPAPPEFIPLEFRARRPTVRQATAFLGRWIEMNATDPHEVEVRASGDTIIVRDRVRAGGGSGPWFEADDPVIQVTGDGTLEWGLPFFRGLAALLVLRGRLLDDGTMEVTREVRGWVPRGPGSDLSKTQRFRRVP